MGFQKRDYAPLCKFKHFLTCEAIYHLIKTKIQTIYKEYFLLKILHILFLRS